MKPSSSATVKREPVNHCRYGRVWHSWYLGYVNCQMRVRGNGYCHHHQGKAKP